MCFFNILFFANKFQFTVRVIFLPHYFYILRAFIIKNPTVFWYHWFKLLGFSSASFFLILVLSSTVIALIFLCRFCTLESSVFSYKEVAFSSTCKSATLLFISFSSSIRRAISCFWWSFSDLKLPALTWLVFCSSKNIPWLLLPCPSQPSYIRVLLSVLYFFGLPDTEWFQDLLKGLSMRFWSWSLAVSISLKYLHLWESSLADRKH